ncbi:hypothetical protein [Mycobacterium sp. E3298]|uniref:hypothetical protein n=1 Tax=Mycobacterium sp. E3298 TaxID=1856865 RepID=UPI0018D4959E|nr:hypothetical protein [Mycobacterium sp. E3298]
MERGTAPAERSGALLERGTAPAERSGALGPRRAPGREDATRKEQADARLKGVRDEAVEDRQESAGGRPAGDQEACETAEQRNRAATQSARADTRTEAERVAQPAGAEKQRRRGERAKGWRVQARAGGPWLILLAANVAAWLVIPASM